jgi:K+-sensing histidine kinase KdpD
MQEVLKNILKNCIEHSPNGKIEIFYGREKNLNKIIIRDNGQGFMFGRENKIFERYFLGDRTKEGSSGLGLSIAQQVIKQHFGTITASNRECGGAEFLILFPQMDATTIY